VKPSRENQRRAFAVRPFRGKLFRAERCATRALDGALNLSGDQQTLELQSGLQRRRPPGGSRLFLLPDRVARTQRARDTTLGSRLS
jgi:hypothetical protein